jgi:hypothetical protein
VDIYKFYSSIKTSLPSQNRNSFIQFLEEDSELLSVLSSFEIMNDYNFSCGLNPNRNQQQISIYEALGKVCYWLQEGDTTSARVEFKKLPIASQQVIKDIFNGVLVKHIGRDFILDTLPQLFEMKDIFAHFIKLPKKLNNAYEDSIKGITRNFDLSKAKLPAYLFTIPKTARKKNNLYYVIKTPNKLYSNLSSNLVRTYFKETFANDNFGCIFVYSKTNKKRFGKQLIPLVVSDNPRTILKLYKGNREVDLNTLSFNTKEFFMDFKSPYIDLKFPQHTKIETDDGLIKSLKHTKEQNYVLFSTGIIKLQFMYHEKIEKIYDYLLDEEYMPIGLRLENGEEYKYRLTEEFVNDGIDNRYVTLVDKLFLGNKVSTQLKNINGLGLSKCPVCGEIVKHTVKGICTSCYKRLSSISKYSIKTEMLIDTPCFSDIDITVGKYRVNGSQNGIKMVADYSLVKGKQLSLPFEEFIIQ